MTKYSNFFFYLKYILFSALVIFSLQACVVLLPFISEEDSTKTAAVDVAKRANKQNISTPRPVVSLLPNARQGKRTLKNLIADLRTGEPVVRVHAAYWLGEMGPRAKKAVPALVSNLNHHHHWVRRASVKSLGKIGGIDAAKALRLSLRDRNKFVAHSAANSLERMSRGGSTVYYLK